MHFNDMQILLSFIWEASVCDSWFIFEASFAMKELKQVPDFLPNSQQNT